MPFGQALVSGLQSQFGQSRLNISRLPAIGLVSGAGPALGTLGAGGAGLGGGIGSAIGGILGTLGGELLRERREDRALDRALEVARTTSSLAQSRPGTVPAVAREIFGGPGRLGVEDIIGPLGDVAVGASRFFGGGGGGGAAMLPTFMLTPKGRPRQGPIGVINPVTGECTFVANLGAPTGFKNWSRRRARRRPR